MTDDRAVDNFEDQEEFDDSELANENNGEIQRPFSTKDVKITTTPITVSSIVNRLKHEEIDLQPAFQRKEGLWSRKKMSRLIESIMLKMPLPIFYFDVGDPDKWLVVDGLQRLSTIKRFIVETGNKRLKLGHLEFLTDLNGKTFAELERPLQRIIEETQLVTYQIEPQTPKAVRYSIFNRINTGGMSLNAQEIRQALNQQGSAVRFLQQITEHEKFREVVNVRNERMLDRELALRFIAFKLTPEFSTMKSLATFLDDGMEKLDQINDPGQLDSLETELIETLAFSVKLLGQKHRFSRAMANKGKTKILNRSMFDVLTVCLSEIEDKTAFLKQKESFQQQFIDMLKDDFHPFTESINKGTGAKLAVITRFKQMRQLIAQVQQST